MSKRYKVGIVGLGAIGLQIARTIDQGNISNFDLVAIATRDEKKAAKKLENFDHVPDITSIKNVCASADVIVECAPAVVFGTIIEEIIEAGAPHRTRSNDGCKACERTPMKEYFYRLSSYAWHP